VTQGPAIIVPDSAAALEALGMASRARAEAVIIGVTGSAARTARLRVTTIMSAYRLACRVCRKPANLRFWKWA
jgi:hypothetical protein